MYWFIVLGFWIIPAFAAGNKAATEPLPEAPPPPPVIESGEEMEADITIIRKGKQKVEEYRRGGKLYMIKVIPDIGPAYYFVDTNGDGKMDVRRSDLDRDSNINTWKIIEWK